MTGLVILCTALALMIMSLYVLNMLSQAGQLYEKRYLTKTAKDLGQMFYFIEGNQLFSFSLAIALVLGLLGALITHVYLTPIFFMLGFVVPFIWIRALKRKRILLFEKQLVDALVQMSATFRAGLSLPQAAEVVSQEMPAPLSQEFGLFVKELKLGVTQENALENMAQRIPSEDLQLVVVSTNVAKQLGGNMAEMYDIIAETIRERFRLEGRIRALTAQGKLQGWVVGAMPLILGLALYWIRPDLMIPMMTSPFGWILSGVVVTMVLAGFWLIRRVVSIDI